MKTIFQRTETDCLKCCLAMVLEMEYEEVPDFVLLYGTDWGRELSKWLLERNKGLIQFNSVPQYIPPWLPMIAKGYPSEKSLHHHCVVWTDKEMFDPHPNNIGILDITERYFIVYKPK